MQYNVFVYVGQTEEVRHFKCRSKSRVCHFVHLSKNANLNTFYNCIFPKKVYTFVILGLAQVITIRNILSARSESDFYVKSPFPASVQDNKYNSKGPQHLLLYAFSEAATFVL